jgi:trimethylamine:corrinoid methyltransferase-like protein
MNTIDRLTRENTGIVAHLEVFLASASFGGGGAKSVAMVHWSMHTIAVADRTLSIGSTELVDDSTLSAIDEFELTVLADQGLARVEVAS